MFRDYSRVSFALLGSLGRLGILLLVCLSAWRSMYGERREILSAMGDNKPPFSHIYADASADYFVFGLFWYNVQ